MSPKQVSDEITTRFGETVGLSSVNYVLFYSAAAKAGRIAKAGYAKYMLDPNWTS